MARREVLMAEVRRLLDREGRHYPLVEAALSEALAMVVNDTMFEATRHKTAERRTGGTPEDALKSAIDAAITELQWVRGQLASRGSPAQYRYDPTAHATEKQIEEILEGDPE